MRVSIIDYGLSNLLSVYRAVEVLGFTPVMVCDAAGVRAAKILILPGVGAFADGMDGLLRRRLIEPVLESAGKGVPLLGICLGMQMLFDTGYEFGVHKGLGLIAGEVRRIADISVDGRKLRVPHIGWEGLLPADINKSFTSPVLQYTRPGDEVYFVHSYAAVAEDSSHILAQCEYGGHRLCAVAGRDNVFGTQFHPEKSGAAGLKILEAFIKLRII